MDINEIFGIIWVIALTAITSCTWWSHLGRQGLDCPIGMLGLLLHIITYYCTIWQTWGFQLNFAAEGDLISTGSSSVCLPSILIVMVKRTQRSLNLTYQVLSGLRTNLSTQCGQVKTKSSWFYTWNILPGNCQHCNHWCPGVRSSAGLPVARFFEKGF